MKDSKNLRRLSRFVASELQGRVVQSGLFCVSELDSEPELARAVLSNNHKSVKHLLDLGADPNECNRSNRNRDNFLGEPPLVHSVRSGNERITALLLNAGANPNLKVSGRSFLYYAIAENQLSCAGLLLKFGAKLSKARRGVPSELEAAVDVASVETFRLLIRHGAELNAPDSDGGSLLHRSLCVYNNSASVLPVYLPGMKKERDRKAEQSLSIVRDLLNLKADVNVVDRFGQTALMAAVQSAPVDVVARIVELGGDINAAAGSRSGTSAGMRPMHYAIAANRPEIVEILARHNADFRTPLPNGMSVVEFARDRDASSCISVLNRIGCTG